MPKAQASPPNPHSAVRALLESTDTAFTTAMYTEGSAIFWQGDKGDTVMHIESGRVWLAVTKPSGKEAICGLLGPGAFLGEEALAGHPVRPHTATAMTETEVLVLAKDRMLQVIHAQPALASQFIEHTLARAIRLQSDLVDQLLFSAEQRLAHTLLLLAGCDERLPATGALPHVSQEIIAEMVGTTRSRVNLFMNRFKKLGFVVADEAGLSVHPDRLRLIQEDRRSRPRAAK